MHVKIVYTGIDHPNHIKALDAMANGINGHDGDTVECEYPTQREPDAYVIFGSWKDRDQPHHNAKREVVNSGKPFVVIETPIFGRRPVKDHIEDDCFRVGVNGFLNNRGKFLPDDFDPTRCKITTARARRDNMVRKLGVNVEPIQNKDRDAPIVLALQLPGDASLEGNDINSWFKQWVDQLSAVKIRKICRFPQLPRQYNTTALEYAESHDWEFQQGTYDNLFDTLKAARFTISYSSGFGVDSLIAGTPAVVDSDASFAYSLAHHGTKNLHQVYMPNEDDREQWLNKLAYHQWFIDEMHSGECWTHIKSILQNI